MQGWIDSSGGAGDVLVRRGTGRVTAVSRVADSGLHRVEIRCDTPPGRPRSVRITVHPLTHESHEAFRVAVHAEQEGLTVEWTIHWIRHDWVPVDLPVSSLDLASDTRAQLTELAIVGVPAEVALWSGPEEPR